MSAFALKDKLLHHCSIEVAASLEHRSRPEILGHDNGTFYWDTTTELSIGTQQQFSRWKTEIAISVHQCCINIETLRLTVRVTH